MKTSLIKLLFASCAIFVGTNCFSQDLIIPRPVAINPAQGQFTISNATTIVYSDEGQKAAADFFNDYLQKFYGMTLKTSPDSQGNFIRISTKKFIKAPENEGHYTLRVDNNGISIDGDSYQGSFYGIQTLIQLLPVEKGVPLSIKGVEIDDQPRFQYRGMHLDVARHFFTVDYVKKYIDYLALHKLNYFHWHLTDDQGWRIEIKQYPKLTEVGGYREGTIVGRYPGTGNTNQRYGGFYTQDDVKEIVEYASKRYITVIPEIEMPGHALAALAAYPELGCKGSGYQVQQTWGVFEQVFCAGNDSVFTFLQNVMDEVIELFPSKYIHIGGDESPKDSWKKCPKCQQRIKTNGLKDEHELQSYFIQRMEKHINAKGRTIIGWDEILEGGLAPNAIVMSWRGEEGGIEAAKQKHQVIMTPGSHMYFDHSQTRHEDSVTFGGYTSVEKVYSYEPVPKELNPEQAKYVLGAQANLWTEYITNPAKVEYHIFPRMSALSEVLWSKKENRDWEHFEPRLQHQFKRYSLWGSNYSNAYFDLKSTILPAKDGKGVLWTLSSEGNEGKIKLARKSNLSQRRTYSAPVNIRRDTEIGATLETNGEPTSWLWQKFQINNATGKTIKLSANPSKNYPGNEGEFGLINGIRSDKGINSSEWLGWNGASIEAVIDLGSMHSVSNVGVHVLDLNGSWIYFPARVEVFVSVDGKKYRKAGENNAVESEHTGMGLINVPFTGTRARYIKVVALNSGKIPEGRAGAGNLSWIFIDEISVN